MDKDRDNKATFYIEPSRIQDWTDGIFAFAMTLLIVSVDIPNLESPVTEEKLSGALVGMMPTFLTFIMSFVLIAIFWMVHHKQFQSIKKSNDALLWINVALMLLVVFMPFTTDLIDDYSNFKIANFVFNLNMFFIGAMFYLQYSYSSSHGLFDERISMEHISHYKRQNSAIAVVSLIALIAGLLSPIYSSYLYLLIPIYIVYINKTRKLQTKYQERSIYGRR